MADENGEHWLSALPWVLLGRRTAFQPDLGTSAAELVLGDTPIIPGDLAGANLSGDTNIPQLLERLRANAGRPPVQTAHHNKPKEPYLPADMANATHVWVRVGKDTPLGVKYKGPYLITARQGTSCLEIRTGSYANGAPRHETVHWNNCKIAYFWEKLFEAERPKRGRKRKATTSFSPDQTSSHATHHPYTARARGRQRLATKGKTDKKRHA